MKVREIMTEEVQAGSVPGAVQSAGCRPAVPGKGAGTQCVSVYAV